MSAATDTVLEVDVLTDLDFTPTLPCEYTSEHDQLHKPDGPAEWTVVAFCGDCGRGGVALICNAGKEQKMLPGVMVECKKCGKVDTWGAFVVSLERIVR